MRHDAPSDRRGFTLLETLIALGLVSIIMSTVWSLLSMFARVERQGAERALELQLVRSIGSQLQSDLDRLAVPVDSSTSSSTALRPPGTLIGTATELRIFCRSVADPWPITAVADASQSAAEPSANPAASLAADTSASSLTANPATVGPGLTAEPAAGTSDGAPYQIVFYQFIPPLDLPPNAAMQVVIPGPLDGTGTRGNALVSQGAASGEFSESGGPAGAMRSSPLGVQGLPAVGNEPDASPTNVLTSDSSQPAIVWAGLRRTVSSWPAAGPQVVPEAAADELPELKRCRFRYFDGTRWLDSWGANPAAVNSTVDQLPAAIEIQFDMDVMGANPSVPEPSTELSGTWTPEYRWVVYLQQAVRGAALAPAMEEASP